MGEASFKSQTNEHTDRQTASLHKAATVWRGLNVCHLSPVSITYARITDDVE